MGSRTADDGPPFKWFDGWVNRQLAAKLVKLLQKLTIEIFNGAAVVLEKKSTVYTVSIAEWIEIFWCF